ncbi:unnamed protein product [Brachionus calyciflorus]|uniref:U5 small nuclear ribonucleoprotein 40 kDa protein n=1 Tax=Brachionus calyciflorus TaxID=104777 RepID=A0A813M2I2_9BILA|nr:unnamed protein product [Brachionus calyciflorus]
MSVKRSNDQALVPANKKTRSEIVAYAAKAKRSETRSSSLFAPIVILAGHESEIFCVKFSPDGSIVASAGHDRKIFLWNVYGECENWACLGGHNGAITDLKFLKDGSEIVTCATDKNIFIWDVQTLERIKRFKGHKDFVNSVDVCRKSPQLFCSGADDNTVKLWDRRKRGEAMTFDSNYQVLSVCFNESGEQIISGGIDNDIKVWDTRKNDIVYKLKGHNDSVTGLSLSPDGNYVASNAMDNTARIWDIRPFAPQDRGVNILFGHNHNFEKNLLRIAWSPDGQLLTAGSADKFLYIWEVDTSKIAYKLPGHNGSINSVDFHPQEPIVASCSSDKKIYLGEL